MVITKMAFLGFLLAAFFASAQFVHAQSAQTGIVKKGDNPYAEKSGYDPYTAANLKIDVLESQLKTLRKKMQLQVNKKAHETKEWDQHYETVKKQIDSWDKFQDEYNME